MKLTILLILITLCGYSQDLNEINKDFTLSLLNEKILSIRDIESDELSYNADLIQLESEYIGNYYEDLYFYKFTIGKNKLEFDENIKMLFSASSCKEFILAFTFDTDMKYRLKGFSGNDLLFLLKDIKNRKRNSKDYTEILSDLKLFVNDLDFDEIYHALINLDFNSKSLESCKDGKKAHGKGE